MHIPFARSGWITSLAFDDKFNTIFFFFKAAALRSHIPKFVQKSQCPRCVAAVCAAIAAPLRAACVCVLCPSCIKAGLFENESVPFERLFRKESILVREWIQCLDIDIFAAGGYVCVFSNIFDLFSSEWKQSCSMAYAMLSCAICKLFRVHW